jgi:hypothetical protein
MEPSIVAARASGAALLAIDRLMYQAQVLLADACYDPEPEFADGLRPLVEEAFTHVETLPEDARRPIRARLAALLVEVEQRTVSSFTTHEVAAVRSLIAQFVLR